jgi:hypothetical protein
VSEKNKFCAHCNDWHENDFLDCKQEHYLIWSVEKNAWWKPNELGYTASWSAAGVYSKEKAFLICAKANTHSLDEIPVPAKYFVYQKKAHNALEDVKP